MVLYPRRSQRQTSRPLPQKSSSKRRFECFPHTSTDREHLIPIPQPCHQLNHTNGSLHIYGFHSQRFHHELHDVNCRRFQGQIQDRAVIILWVSHAANQSVRISSLVMVISAADSMSSTKIQHQGGETLYFVFRHC